MHSYLNKGNYMNNIVLNYTMFYWTAIQIVTGLTDTESNNFPVVVLVSSSSNSKLNLCLNQRRTFWAFRSSLNRNWKRRFRARQLSLLGMSLLCNASTKLCNTQHHFYTSYNPEGSQRLRSSQIYITQLNREVSTFLIRFLWNTGNLIWNYTASHPETTIILMLTAMGIP
jgi:hypothetical protein